MHLDRQATRRPRKRVDMVRNLEGRGENEAADIWLRIIVGDRGVAARVGDMMVELVMAALATLDQVAFIRSTSVY